MQHACCSWDKPGFCFCKRFCCLLLPGISVSSYLCDLCVVLPPISIPSFSSHGDAIKFWQWVIISEHVWNKVLKLSTIEVLDRALQYDLWRACTRPLYCWEKEFLLILLPYDYETSSKSSVCCMWLGLVMHWQSCDSCLRHYRLNSRRFIFKGSSPSTGILYVWIVPATNHSFPSCPSIPRGAQGRWPP